MILIWILWFCVWFSHSGLDRDDEFLSGPTESIMMHLYIPLNMKEIWQMFKSIIPIVCR